MAEAKRRHTGNAGKRPGGGIREKFPVPLACLIFAAVAFLPVLSSPAAAAPASQQSYNYTKSSGISVEQAAAMVRRETGGRVLSANPTKSNGQRGYNVRVLVDGKRIKQYYVDDQGRMTPK